MTPENDEKLCKKYPKIFRDRGGTMQETCMYWGLAVGDGWYDLIDNLCACLQNHADNEGTEEAQVVAAQVKEKFGGLRFYTNNGDECTRGMVTMAEAMSYCICEDCGNKATVRTRGYVRSLCGNCATKQKALWAGDKK